MENNKHCHLEFRNIYLQSWKIMSISDLKTKFICTNLHDETILRCYVITLVCFCHWTFRYHLLHENQILHECVHVHKTTHGRGNKISVVVEVGQNCPEVWRFGVSNAIFILFMKHIGDMISCQLILICYLCLTILSTNNKHRR